MDRVPGRTDGRHRGRGVLAGEGGKPRTAVTKQVPEAQNVPCIIYSSRGQLAWLKPWKEASD